MISIIGLGNGGSSIAEKFSPIPQYNVYLMNNKIKRNSKYKFKLKAYETPEEYEGGIPRVKKFFSNLDDRVQIFVVGSAYSTNYVLGILEQIRDKKIEVFYIQPDVELLTGVPKLLESTAIGVLQEYARSGLFESITLLSNLNIESTLGDVPIKTYFDVLNNSIFSAAHYVNYFNHTEPEIGNVARPSEINRIRTIALLNMKNLEEKWLFDLDNPRELCYYLCINEEKLASDGTLHKKIVDMLKDKPKNAFRKISYAIYETEHTQDFGFCVAHTNAIQQEKTLDMLDQE
tara:strand:+ start:1763 stop:2629 length:867 start_codon:yes stop_codon:yes gene_type:complete